MNSTFSDRTKNVPKSLVGIFQKCFFIFFLNPPFKHERGHKKEQIAIETNASARPTISQFQKSQEAEIYTISKRRCADFETLRL